jgi:hypothetical protein
VGGNAQNHDRSFESEFGFGNDLLYPTTLPALTLIILFLKMLRFIYIYIYIYIYIDTYTYISINKNL